MITTPCHLCCFCDRQAKACLLGQMCVDTNGVLVTPGFCRLHRTHAWKRRALASHGNEAALYRIALDEAALRFDLLVLFDQGRHKVADLGRTINNLPECQNLIVADMTLPEHRTSEALQTVQREHSGKPFRYEVFLESAESQGQAVDRIQRLVKSPYFFVIEAGKRVASFSALTDHLGQVMSRAVYWHFPMAVGETAMVTRRSGLGLYLTHAYRKLGGNVGRPFHEKLALIEQETGWAFDFLIDGGLIH